VSAAVFRTSLDQRPAANTINITIDGVSNGNAANSGDGFFTQVRPRLMRSRPLRFRE
jgi:hypothetical protein